MKIEIKLGILGGAVLAMGIVGLVIHLYILPIIALSLILAGVIIGYYVVKYNKTHLRVIKQPPNVFRFNDGTFVSGREDWVRRREELKEIMQKYEYGHLPQHPEKIVVTPYSSQSLPNGGSEQFVILSIYPKAVETKKFINLTVQLYIPEGTGPFPALVKVSLDGTGTQEPIGEYMIQRGYLYASYNHQELDLDTFGLNPKGLCQLAYPEYDWATLGVWAWGAMRVLDYLLQEPWVEFNDDSVRLNIDPDKTIVTGHSRRGKTALLAGALDERFKMVVPNGSGCGGAGSFLVLGAGAQGVGSIASPKRYESWFQIDIKQFANNEKALPFDQHFMRALVAPRIILSTDGFADLWANPTGAQAVFELAQPVFDLLGTAKHNTIHFREGGHAFKQPDFEVILDLADHFFFGKSFPDRHPEEDYYQKPFDLSKLITIDKN